MQEARERFERCQAWESQARQNALMDQKFAAGDAYNGLQWEASVRNARAGRPSLTMNKTRQHNLQIVNDARQHKAQIKVTPTGGEATYDAAQVFSGIIRRIEYQSKAVDAYSTGIYHQVESGIGYCRIDHRYVDDDSFDQDLFIDRIADPNTVYLDPDAKEYDKADMNFAFVFTDVPRDQFDKEHGEGYMPAAGATLDNTDGWNDKDHVRKCEYFRRNTRNDKLHLMVDGSVIRDSDVPEADMAVMKPLIVQTREVGRPEIEWFRIVGTKIEERKVWPGRYIPLVPFIGEETVIDGVMDRKGHTRALIDSQRMYNYWVSAAVEQVALQGKVPWVADSRATEGHETQWDSANTVSWSVLYYNGVDSETGQPIEKPERVAPPVMAQAYLQGMETARLDMMMVSGQYQANVGAPSNEISGTAIQQRQRQGDNATYHFIDNQAKAIRQCGRILIDLIPHIYDTARVTKIMAEDGSESDVHLQPDAPVAHGRVHMTPQGPAAIPDDSDEEHLDVRVIFNPNVGRYDVEADVGPSFGTRREEAFNAFSQIMASNKEAFPIVGDIWAMNADFPGADELAKRMKRGLPPQYKAGPDPQMQAVTQHAQQLLGQADGEIAHLKAQVALLTEQSKNKDAETAIKDYEAETKRLAAVGQIDPASLQIIVRQMVEEMLGTPLHPMLERHAAIEQSLAPPAPPPNGAMVQ